MLLRRGTTPTITCNIQEDIDLTQITDAWLYISQGGKLVVDREIADLVIDPEKHTIKATLTQEETLSAKEGLAKIQLRLKTTDNMALGSEDTNVCFLPIYKEGEI